MYKSTILHSPVPLHAPYLKNKSGGGRAELAQGGGPDAGKIDEALERGMEVLRESLVK